MFENFFKDKKILVTGHTGFQGSWLTLWLKLLGANVIGYSLPPPTKPSLFESLEIESDITVGRVLVRASGTEPKIRIMIEAPEESVAIKFVNDIENLIRSKI